MEREIGDQALVIDCHAQAGRGVTWNDPERPVDYHPEVMLERAAEAGINRICIMAARNDSYAQANADVARLCERHSDRLIGFAVHSPQREAGHLKAVLTEEVRSSGFKGLKTDGHPTREVLDVVAELGIPVIYYPAQEPCSQLTRMYHLMAATYPSVNFILPHLGAYRSSPWGAHLEAIALAKRHRNIHLEASGLDGHQYLEMAAQELPAEQIVFGSFAPEHDARVELYAFKLLKLASDQEAKTLGGNMQRLLQLRGSAT
jgi:predicted TIM-barrel fold metal-dependent hydrolase